MAPILTPSPAWVLPRSTVRLRSGIEMAYADIGPPDGPVAILLHGLTNDADAWADTIGELRLLVPWMRLIVPDLRGHGLTGLPPGEAWRSDPDGAFTMDAIAVDVIDLMDALGIARANLVGHSMGSLVAQRVVIDQPDRVESLALLATTSDGAGTPVLSDWLPTDVIERRWRPMLEAKGVRWPDEAMDLTPLDADPDAVAWMQQFWNVYPLTPGRSTQEVAERAARVPLAVWVGATDGILAVKTTQALRGSAIPTLVLWGTQDAFFHRERQEALVEALRSSSREFTWKQYGRIPLPADGLQADDLGHNLTWDAPRQVAADLAAFWTTGAPAPDAYRTDAPVDASRIVVNPGGAITESAGGRCSVGRTRPRVGSRLVTLTLAPDEQAMLDGEHGPAAALSMRLIAELGRIRGAERLVDVDSVHIDGCIFYGQAGLDFAQRLVELGGRVTAPTTVNVGSVDLIHPTLVRESTERERWVAQGGRDLMQAYVDLGCRQTWTCAPYQMDSRPEFGRHIAWAESNAIVFANSVLGARTDRYGDFIDIAAAITGKAPCGGLHLDAERYGHVVLDCTALSAEALDTDVTYPILGYLAGSIAGTRNPVFVGLPTDTSEDRLKAIGSAAASSGGVALFHAVGRTPEAPTLEAALGPHADAPRHLISGETLDEARRQLSTATEDRLDAVSIGTPHASVDEIQEAYDALVGGAPVAPGVAFYISTGRSVYAEAERRGLIAPLEEAGITFVLDTCTYVTSILRSDTRTVMTNSGKWAHYAPGNLGIDVVLATLAECVESARSGRVTWDRSLFA